MVFFCNAGLAVQKRFRNYIGWNSNLSHKKTEDVEPTINKVGPDNEEICICEGKILVRAQFYLQKFLTIQCGIVTDQIAIFVNFRKGRIEVYCQTTGNAENARRI